MSSNSGFPRPFKLARTLFPPSSTVDVTPPLASRTTAELQCRPQRPKQIVKRLLQSDRPDHVFAPEASLSGISDLAGHHTSAMRYLLQTEVHTYAFSVAANAILSFFPFIVLLLTITRRVFHSTAMYNVILELLRQYLPSNQDFLIRNLQFLASVRGRGQLFSFIMLLITSTGIFLPLEVALNRIWGFRNNRSYLMNQIVALGLTLACGLLMLASIALTAQNLEYLGLVMVNHDLILHTLSLVVLKASAIVASIAVYFLIYWLLPNGKVPIGAVLPAAVLMGLVTQAAKFFYVLALPWLNFQEVYGPFSISVTLIFWSFITGMLILLGAYLSAAKHVFRHAI